MRTVNYIIGLFCFLSVAISGQENIRLVVGDRVHDYSTALSGEVGSIEDLRLLDYDIHCVEVNEVIQSQIPKVDLVLSNGNRKMLIGYKDDMLVWKGEEGPDPFLGVAGKYFQFKDGVPLYNLREPSDFDRSGELSIYLEYKASELPEDLNIWCTLLEYDRVKVKVKVVFHTDYIDQHEYPFSEVVSHELRKRVLFEVIDIKAKKAEEWIELAMDAHPALPTYFKPTLIEDIVLADVDNPLGKVVLSTSPENKVMFRSKSALIDLPVCNDSENQVYVYPNPTFGDVTLRMEDNGYGPFTFELFNVVGHPLLKETFESSESTVVTRFDLSYLDKGIYLYSIKDRRGALLQTKRLIIVKR